MTGLVISWNSKPVKGLETGEHYGLRLTLNRVWTSRIRSAYTSNRSGTFSACKKAWIKISNMYPYISGTHGQAHRYLPTASQEEELSRPKLEDVFNVHDGELHQDREVHQLPRNRRHTKMVFSMILCRGLLAYLRHLHRNPRDFRRIFGRVVLFFLVRLICHFRCGWHFPVITHFTVRYVDTYT